jgi:hypothetical protein
MDSPAVQNDSPAKGPGSNPALVIGLIVIGVAALALGGYAIMRAGGLEKPTPIAEITANIRDWDGKAVTIEGTVSDPLNIVVAKMYRLSDDTGEMLVVTEKGLPAAGESVRVDGYVKQAFKVGTIEQTIVFEPAAGATADE